MINKVKIVLAMVVIAVGFGSGLQAQTASVWATGADGTWSTAVNWTKGVPGLPGGTTTNIAQFGAAGSTAINVDQATTGLIKLNFQPNAKDFTFSGGTIDIYDGAAYAIENNNPSAVQTFNNNIVLHQTASDAVAVGNADDGLIVLNGSLTTSNSIFNIKGPLTFANTVDNDIAGQLVISSPTTLTVNTADGINFYDGAKIQFNYNSALTFNGANIIGDSTVLNVGAAVTDVTVAFNADETLGALAILGSGLTLDLGADVSDLIFGDSSERTWNDGLTITNFRSGVIGFGVDGLSSDQLASITIYDTTGVDISSQLEMDPNGLLVIPEPTTVSLLVLSFGVLVAVRRSRYF